MYILRVPSNTVPNKWVPYSNLNLSSPLIFTIMMFTVWDNQFDNWETKDRINCTKIAKMCLNWFTSKGLIPIFTVDAQLFFSNITFTSKTTMRFWRSIIIVKIRRVSSKGKYWILSSKNTLPIFYSISIPNMSLQASTAQSNSDGWKNGPNQYFLNLALTNTTFQ